MSYLDLVSGLIIVKTRIWNGMMGLIFEFALDTGATTTIVSPGTMEMLGYDLSDPVGSVPLVTGSHRTEAKQYQLDRFESLGHEESNMLVTCVSFPQSMRLDGFLGLDFFRNRRLIIDLRRGSQQLVSLE